MKRIFIIILSAIIVTSTFAQHENADAVFEKITKTYTLNDDGSMSYHYFKQLKYLTHTSFNRFYGETFIVYDPDVQELKINESYTIMANGTRVNAPDNAFNEVLPRAAAHSVSFNHLREMVVTHTGLELGATVYLDYTLTTKTGFWPALMCNEIIQESSPVDELEIIVKVPPDVELHHKMFNLRTGPEIMVVGHEKVYSWKFMGLKASPKESFRGDMPDTPRLIFSTVKKTGVLLDWVMRQKAFDYIIDDDMMKFAGEAMDTDDEIGTMVAIQEEVVKNMKYDGVPLDWIGYEVRTPIEVWNSNGGTKLEKAILLTSLLKAANFNAAPVLIGPRKFYDKNVADLLLFDNVAVMVNTKGFGAIYISVTEMNDQSLEYDFGNDVIIPLYKDADNSAREPSAGKNEILLSAKFEVSRDMKLTGNGEAELYGAVNPFVLLKQDDKNFKTILSGGMVIDSVVKVLNLNVAKSQVQFEIEKEKAFSEQLDYYTWQLPEITNGFSSWHINYLSSERKDAFVLPYVLSEIYAYEIVIPEGFDYINIKQAVNLKNKAGSVKIEIIPKKNIITVKRELNLNSQVIKADEYNELRELINHWLDENMKTIVIKKAVDGR